MADIGKEHAFGVTGFLGQALLLAVFQDVQHEDDADADAGDDDSGDLVEELVGRCVEGLHQLRVHVGHVGDCHVEGHLEDLHEYQELVPVHQQGEQNSEGKEIGHGAVEAAHLKKEHAKKPHEYHHGGDEVSKQVMAGAVYEVDQCDAAQGRRHVDCEAG